MKKFKNYRLTILVGSFVIVMLIISLTFNLDLAETFIAFLKRFEGMELDEILLALVILIFAFTADLWLQRKERTHQEFVEAQRLHILRATMVTVMDTVNTLVASIQLFQYDLVDRKMNMPLEMAQLNKSVKDTVIRLRRIQRIDRIKEKKLGENIYAIETPDEESFALEDAL